MDEPDVYSKVVPLNATAPEKAVPPREMPNGSSKEFRAGRLAPPVTGNHIVFVLS